MLTLSKLHKLRSTDDDVIYAVDNVIRSSLQYYWIVQNMQLKIDRVCKRLKTDVLQNGAHPAYKTV